MITSSSMFRYRGREATAALLLWHADLSPLLMTVEQVEACATLGIDCPIHDGMLRPAGRVEVLHA